MSPKILIVEDEPSIAENIVYALEADGFSVAVATTGREALQKAVAEPWALVILDVGLPDMTGFEVCQSIRRTQALPILFLTARSSEVDRVVGLEIGGDDYVLKPFSPRELVARVRAILRRVSSMPAASPGTACAAQPLSIDEVKCSVTYYGEVVAMTRYEYRLLKAFAAHPGRVFNREQLMEACSEEPDASMERTIDTHIKTLRSRLRGIRSDVDPIVTHRGLGYSLIEEWPEAGG
jgi:two-component system, OmpR family, catabolic regulation response regulator CreB